MDIPTIQRSIAELERSLTCLEHWLLFFTFLVAFGLILECCREIPEAITVFRKGILDPLHEQGRPLLLKTIVIIGGLVLITVGVSGEFVVQFFASAKETSLRKDNDDVFTILNTKAVEALAEAARLQKLAEDERLARVKIEEDVAWRRLTKDQQRTMAVRLKSFSNETVFIHYNLNDLEADSFAIDIAGALQQAKWKAVFEPESFISMREGPVPLGTNPPPERGVIITSTVDQTSHSLADAVRRVLEKFGFDATRASHDDTRPHSAVYITIQHRPEGPQGEAKLRHKR